MIELFRNLQLHSSKRTKVFTVKPSGHTENLSLKPNRYLNLTLRHSFAILKNMGKVALAFTFTFLRRSQYSVVVDLIE